MPYDIGAFGMKGISVSFVKIICASLLMGIIAKLIFNTLLSRISQNLSFVISMRVGVLVYFAIVYFIRIEEVDVMVGMVKKLFQE